MIATTLDELQVYHKALQGSKAVSALLKRPAFCKDFKLHQQLGGASDSVCSNISEGFGQQSDRKFAQYLFVARGSANEVRAHLTTARYRDYIADQELSEVDQIYNAIGKMLTRLIQHLRRCDRSHRG